ncbi:MAG TPA: class I SAM-dependent methyltransferase [Vicinamibacterales bacterium]|nr:class I SAM-dependent methyltransferase [Vicinamibacterales bacterium]
MSNVTIREQFGDIDIYLFDQLLRGRIAPGMRVLDAGCGYGRNLVYMLRAGVEVFGVDQDPDAIAAVRALAAAVAPQLPSTNFAVEAVESMSIPDHTMHAVISSAVLHFARDDAHFEAMVTRMWRALAPGGLLFCRLASSAGIEAKVTPLGAGRYRLPDGSERYLVSEERLVALTRGCGGTLVDPIKSTIVQDLRCMATWVVRAPA